jgi:hypothetical protein
VCSQPRFDWVNNNNMTTPPRHFSEFTPILKRTANAFAPWKLPGSRPLGA